MEELVNDYKAWLIELKGKIRSVQIKAAIAVNSELIDFYWELGKSIYEKQTLWGSRFLENLSKDLMSEFPEMKGFSVTNLKYCRLFYNYFLIRPQPGDEIQPQIGQQPGDELPFKAVRLLPWGHIKLIISQIKDLNEAYFYINQTIANNWSRDVLASQLKSGLYKRSGKAISNFMLTLPEPMGVSEFEITEHLPENLLSSLPTIEEIERELNT